MDRNHSSFLKSCIHGCILEFKSFAEPLFYLLVKEYCSRTSHIDITKLMPTKQAMQVMKESYSCEIKRFFPNPVRVTSFPTHTQSIIIITCALFSIPARQLSTLHNLRIENDFCFDNEPPTSNQMNRNATPQSPIIIIKVLHFSERIWKKK